MRKTPIYPRQRKEGSLTSSVKTGKEFPEKFH